MKISKEQYGFTLIELLLYVAIVPLILGAAIGLFYMSTQSQIKNRTINEVQQQGNAIVDTLNKTIQSASAITSPTSGNSGSSLTLAMDSAPINPTIFDLSSGTIRVTEGAASPVSLNNDKITATNLTFSNRGLPSTSGGVSYSFTLTYINNSGRQVYDYSQTFYGGGSLRP